MAINQFPPAATGGATDTAFAATLTDMGKLYQNDVSLTAGVYRLDISPTSTNAVAQIYNGTTLLTTVTTTSGTVTFNLSTAATKVYITGRQGGTAGAIATFTKTAGILSPDDIGNGTLDTITTTGTYNQTGALAVLVIGGGGYGGKGQQNNYTSENGAGAGGRVGYINVGFVTTNSATTVTIGAGGIASNTNSDSPTEPTQSNFGNLVTANTLNNTYMYTSQVSQAFKSWVSTNDGTTGAGGRGSWYQNNELAGQGSGIGTGGTGGGNVTFGGAETNGNPTNLAGNGTGYGSGGGGGSFAGNNHPNAVGRFGGDGANGVVYVLRGF